MSGLWHQASLARHGPTAGPRLGIATSLTCWRLVVQHLTESPLACMDLGSQTGRKAQLGTAECAGLLCPQRVPMAWLTTSPSPSSSLATAVRVGRSLDTLSQVSVTFTYCITFFFFFQFKVEFFYALEKLFPLTTFPKDNSTYSCWHKFRTH